MYVCALIVLYVMEVALILYLYVNVCVHTYVRTCVCAMQVRVHAQRVLAQCAKEFLFAGLCLVPDILPLLKKDEKVSHEQFKVRMYDYVSNTYVHVHVRTYVHVCIVDYSLAASATHNMQQQRGVIARGLQALVF